MWAAFEAAGDRVPPAPEDVCLPSNLIDLQCLAGAYCPPGGGPTHGVPPFGFRPPPHVGRGTLSQKRHTSIPISPLASSSSSRARPPAALTFAADETASATARLEAILSDRAEGIHYLCTSCNEYEYVALTLSNPDNPLIGYVEI